LFPSAVSKKKVYDLKHGREEGIFVVCASVLGPVEGGDFCYSACYKCNRKVCPDSGSYYCNDCDMHVYQITPRCLAFLIYCFCCLISGLSIFWLSQCGFCFVCRFKVDVNVSDGREDAVFVLFDSDVHFIIGKSCAEVLEVSKVVCFNLCFFYF
jgi:hypothetical protein